MHLLCGKENGQKYIKLIFEFFGVAKKICAGESAAVQKLAEKDQKQRGFCKSCY